MQVFEFSSKEQVNVFSIFMTISITLGILVFFDLNDYSLHASTAFFIVSLISFISLILAVKRANKTFKEIRVDKNKFDFHFTNKMKDRITLHANQFSVVLKDDFIEIKDNEGNIIGKAYKNRIKIKEGWVVLTGLLKQKIAV